MRNSVNYLKFDLRIIKENVKQYLLIPLIPFVIFMFSGHAYTFGIAYLSLFLVVLAAIPFSMQGNEKSTEMYFMFPAKISSMVIGRFLYLICSTLIIFIVNGLVMAYLYKINQFQDFEILSTCLSGLVSLIICFIQYPLYYKVGIENGRLISMVIYLIPAFILFMLPNFLKKSDLLTNLIFSNSNKFVLMLLSLLIIIFIGYISYVISCRICKKKEV